MQKQRNKEHTYNPSAIEKKWQEKWQEWNIYSPDMDTVEKPFYNLMMFPYPSAEGMHVGNMYAFTGTDVYGRFQRMQGNTVFEPIGLDGFGIHSENYALKIGTHPMEQAKTSEENFYRQLRATGNGYDWTRTVETYAPDYYKWTQWLFIQMFKAGLAYRKKAAVNFCPSCKTVLADEQVIDGKCERCSSMVEKRELEQWFFRITTYADRLLSNIEKLDWTPKVKIAQTNWIGRSDGASITFEVEGSKKNTTILEVFTTRPDTLYGATFLVISPEHPLAVKIAENSQSLPQEKVQEVHAYIAQAKNKTEQERRTTVEKEKTGVFSGLYAKHPITGEKLPIWIADYVLMGYGTGAIMAVPAHDTRDFAFAKKYNLGIKPVIASTSSCARSYLMGAETMTEKDLTALGIHIAEKTPEGYYKIEIPKDKLVAYETLITEKMAPGFWNEYIADEIVFLFKHKNGEVERLVLDEETEVRVNTLAATFNEEEVSEERVWEWLPKNSWYTDMLIHTQPGTIIHSQNWNGLSYPKDLSIIIADLEEKGVGKKEVHYHLRDWLISRQRYWGAPIPMIYCQSCAQNNQSWFTTTKNNKKMLSENAVANMAGWYPAQEEQLPVILPFIEDFKPMGTGTAPLANHPEFYETSCPRCGSTARRETDVSDTFLDSSWYFFRYTSTEKKEEAFTSHRVKKWLPVTMYIGGAEHSVLHLLYSRFVTMVLSDLGYCDFEEPFTRFFAHGLLVKEGAKMSKSKGNVVIPDAYILKYGADTLRTYLMFLGPFSQGGDFYDTGIEGMHRFLKRVWFLFTSHELTGDTLEKDARRILHKTVKKVTEDVSTLRYNTAIAALMEYYNFLAKQETVTKEERDTFLKLLAPFAPHLTEELWQMTHSNEEREGENGPIGSLHVQPWPTYDPAHLQEEDVTIAIQVNGKLRGSFTASVGLIKDQEAVEQLAKVDEKVQKYLEGKTLKKVIYVPGKIINFVI